MLANFVVHSGVRFSSFGCALELGAGCGLSGIAFASAHPTARVILSDADTAVLRRLSDNVALNFGEDGVENPDPKVDCNF